MSKRPPDSEQEEIEVYFNSCSPATVTVHNSLLAQLIDPENQVTPSASPLVTRGGDNPADYVDILLTPDAAHKINWDYTTVDPDNGFVLLELVDPNGAVNPIEKLRRDVSAIFEKKLKPLHRVSKK